MKITVNVHLDVEVDPEVWADAYGLAFDTVGPAGRALREDIDLHTKNVVRDAAAEAVARLGSGAVLA